MAACQIRYRLEGSHPQAMIVECDGVLRLHTEGLLGGTTPQARLLAILADRGCDWIPSAGAIEVDVARDTVPFPAAPFGLKPIA